MLRRRYLVGWTAWCKASQGMTLSVWTLERKAKLQEKKPSTPPWARLHGLYSTAHAHTITKAMTQRQSLCEHSSKEFGIPALAFIKAHTSGFSLAFFMMFLQSLSVAW